jgi:ATP-dependent Clp protease ATP-binding subunit ClpA
VKREGPVHRLTERARLVVILADDEARRGRRRHIATEDLLLGLLREEESLAASILDEFGVTVGEVRAMVERKLARSA